MKTLKNYINEINGLRFIYENLKLHSGIGRKYILNQKFITDKSDLEQEFENVSGVFDFTCNINNSAVVDNVNGLLHQINDIHSTINNIRNKRILDDIELFEVKKFSILSRNIVDELVKSGFKILEFCDLNNVINILDPEQTGIPSFYIYSKYDEHLSELRKKYKKLITSDPDEAESIRLKSIEIEDEIREKLSGELFIYAESLYENLDKFAYLDTLFAKVTLAKDFNLSKPYLSTDKIEYKYIFNPQVKNVLESSGKNFQSIDICLNNEPCLITGANMSGKTVLLKTIALSQYLFQFGFYVPADYAKIPIFDEIIFSIGDNQSELNGLSSFAVEMLNINKIITEVKKGRKVLALVDELARTTNPEEGKALVSAFLSIMSEHNVCSIITTHYGGITSDCRRLRVKGLIFDGDSSDINVNNINDFMDYSLIEVNDDSVPNEAIRIIEILDIDKEFIRKAKEYLV